MQIANIPSDQEQRVPVIIDVERNIDGYPMIRCSYMSVQADEPVPQLHLEANDATFPILLLNMEAIILGTPGGSDVFDNVDDIERMYDYVEAEEKLFLDINDIWIPKAWFGKNRIRQGLLYRMPVDRFVNCWKLRNDKISSEEMFKEEDILDDAVVYKYADTPVMEYSEQESNAFNNWTKKQIERSREIYQANRDRTLQKIRE